MTKIRFDFDPEAELGIRVKKEKREEAYDRAGAFIRDSILSTVGGGTSPVSGESWKRSLSPEYARRKKEVSSADFANMELHGDLLDSISTSAKGRKIRIEVGEDQNDKADGHCNFSGKSKLPRRRFIPNGKEGQTFKKNILDGVKQILAEYEE